MDNVGLKRLSVYHGNNMKFFNKQELIVTIFIFILLVGVSTPSFIKSLQRARDQIRRDDLGSIQKMIDSYHSQYKKFPPSSADGKIVACDLRGCMWGKDLFYNIGRIPGDPDSKNGITYMYFSDTNKYQIFISQEGDDEPEYDQKIINRKIMCGKRYCNSGRSYNCPIDKSIEECSIIK